MKIVDHIEETFIAFVLGIMVMVTFANVIARYVFNDNLLWALETTVFLFAWLVLIGASYCVKKNAHLGVDVFVRMLPAGLQRMVTLIAGLFCLSFALLVLYGAWTYWAPFAGERAWYEVDDIRMPEWLQFLAPSMNEGERWEKLPRFIPYFCLPLGFALLVIRLLQATIRVWTGKQDLLIANHEVEELMEEVNS